MFVVIRDLNACISRMICGFMALVVEIEFKLQFYQVNLHTINEPKHVPEWRSMK